MMDFDYACGGLHGMRQTGYSLFGASSTVGTFEVFPKYAISTWHE